MMLLWRLMQHEGLYDLQGRRLAEEPAKGLYIKDGRKYTK